MLTNEISTDWFALVLMSCTDMCGRPGECVYSAIQPGPLSCMWVKALLETGLKV